MKWTLNLYPPAWRKRFRHEMESHLEAEPFSLRTVLDLIAGAVDAWLNSELVREPITETGVETMITASRHECIDISKSEALRGAAWMIGISLLLATVGVALDKAYGDHILTKALLFSAFFIAFIVSLRHTYLKPYSPTARNVITVAGSIGVYVFFVGVTALSAIV